MKSKHVRLAAQIFFFLLIATISINHILIESGQGFSIIPAVSLHAICPFGAVATFASLVTGQGLIRQLHASVMVIGAVVLLLTILFGPIFCSHICPLGSIQEWLGKIGKKIFKKKYNRFIPKKVHNVLKYFRYVLLGLILVNTYQSASLVFAGIDPYYALFHFWTGEVAISALLILVVTLLMSLFVERPWCKYVCPYGGLLGLIGKISLFKVHRSETSCISCNRCTQACPMLIDVAAKEVINDTLCNRCMQCTAAEGGCPVDGACYNAIGQRKDGEDQ